MLDKRCLCLLEYIDKECLNGGYKVFAVQEFLSALPEEFGLDTEGVFQCLKVLSAKEYVAVKYQDENEVCLSPLPKGRAVFENRLDEEVERALTERKYLRVSFLGSLAGGVVSGLLFTAILLLTGAG